VKDVFTSPTFQASLVNSESSLQPAPLMYLRRVYALVPASYKCRTLYVMSRRIEPSGW